MTLSVGTHWTWGAVAARSIALGDIEDTGLVAAARERAECCRSHGARVCAQASQQEEKALCLQGGRLRSGPDLYAATRCRAVGIAKKQRLTVGRRECAWRRARGLTDITERIIAMGFPSEGREGVYRNPMSEVQRYVDRVGTGGGRRGLSRSDNGADLHLKRPFTHRVELSSLSFERARA